MSTKTTTTLLAGSPVKTLFPRQARAVADRGVTRSEINISGIRVLLALAIAFLLTNGIIWAFVRYWLFKP